MRPHEGAGGHFNAANTIKELTTDRSTLEQWAERGVKCKTARFHQPCPVLFDMEPVGEFRILTRDITGKLIWEKNGKVLEIRPLDMKYFVELLSYTPYGLIWKSGKEINITPLANVNYVRAIT